MRVPAKIIVGFGKTLIQFDRAAAASLGTAQVAMFALNQSEGIVGCAILGIEFEGSAQAGFGAAQVSFLQQQQVPLAGPGDAKRYVGG